MALINFVVQNDLTGRQFTDNIEFPVIPSRGWGNWYWKQLDIAFEEEADACKAVCKYYNETRTDPKQATRSFVSMGTYTSF